MQRILLGCLALVTASALGCSKKQTFEEAIREACEFPERAETRAKLEKLTPSEQAAYLTKEIDRRITNSEARRELFETVAPTSAERDARLLTMTRRAKIDKCWLLGDASAPPATTNQTPATSAAGLEPLQGRWHFDYTKTNAPSDATSTTWVIRGNDIQIIEGSRERNFKLRLVAPCMVKIVGLVDDTPFVPFLTSERGLTFGSAVGLRRNGKVIVCDKRGRVIERDDSGCRARKLSWLVDSETNVDISCKLERKYDRDAFVARASDDTFDTLLFFNGDRLTNTTTPENPQLPVGSAK